MYSSSCNFGRHDCDKKRKKEKGKKEKKKGKKKKKGRTWKGDRRRNTLGIKK
jgi:hypothetical protein